MSIDYAEALYDCGTQTMLEVIAQVPDDIEVLLVVAHAPAVPGLSQRLTESARQADDLHYFPTSAYSEFGIDGSWAELSEGPDGPATFVGVTRG